MKKKNSRVRPLITGQKVLTWFCVYPIGNKTENRKLFYFLFSFLFLISLICAVAMSAVFFFRYISVDLEECLHSLFQIAAGMSGCYMIIVAFFMRFKFKRMFENLEKIYEESKRIFLI